MMIITGIVATLMVSKAGAGAGIPTNVRAMQAQERNRNMQSGPEPVLQVAIQLRLHGYLSAERGAYSRLSKFGLVT